MKLGVYVLRGDMLIANGLPINGLAKGTLVRLVVESIPECYLLMACTEESDAIEFDVRDRAPVRETRIDYWLTMGWEVVRQ